ncbi:MAG: hypothetical protein ABH879_10735 [archaeon]
MVHPVIQQKFDKYVALAAGNFGFRDALLEEMEISTPDVFSGSLIIRNGQIGQMWDCESTRYRLGKELEGSGFEVRYPYTQSNGTYHHFLEILDTDDDKWIQFDPSPWFQTINPGHPVSGYGVSDEDYSYVEMWRSIGPILSLHRSGPNFVQTFICGGYESPASRGPVETPDRQYEVKLYGMRRLSLFDETQIGAQIAVNVLDSGEIQGQRAGMETMSWVCSPYQALGNLRERKQVELEVVAYTGNGHDREFVKLFEGDSVASLDAMVEAFPEAGDVVRNLRHNMGVLANVVFHLSPEIRTEGGQTVNVAKGSISGI